MSLVTAQGIEASHKADGIIADTARAIAEYLTGGARSVAELVEHFDDRSSDTVREAMWRLLDAKQAAITSDRKLQSTRG